MLPLTELEIRTSFINATEVQLARLPMPGLHETIWNEREFLGWRDTQAAHLGYIVQRIDDRPVGIVVRAATTRMRQGIAAMCSFCHSTQPATQVKLFTAPKAGRPGLDGNTLGTYICESLSCSHVIRLAPPHLTTPTQLAARGEAMLQRLERFTRRLMADAEGR